MDAERDNLHDRRPRLGQRLPQFAEPPAQWPTIPMNLTLQSQNQDSAQPSGTIETMTVAWVAEYAMNG